MTALHRGGLIRALVNVVSPFGIRDADYMIKTGPYDRTRRNFAANDVTSDERRYRFTDDWFAADPRLRLGGPTCGWLRQAQRSIDMLGQSGYLERIGIPLTIVSAGKDKVVDMTSHAPIAARIPGAKHVVVDGAEHEILMETNPLRARFWAAFDALAVNISS
jgi:lysophospholipase